MKLKDTIPKTYVLELTEPEIYALVYRLKFIKDECDVTPDPTESMWKSLETLLSKSVQKQVY